MRILMLGGTGFIGPFVIRRLIALGHQVTVVHRGVTEPDLPGPVQHIHDPSLSLGNRQGLLELRERFRLLVPDVVIDMVPMVEHDARIAVEAFRALAHRLVVISSGDVYRAHGVLTGHEPGPLEPMPLVEDAPLRRKLYPYRAEAPRDPNDPERWVDDYDKILVERVVMASTDLPATVVRLPMVYGPGDKQHRLFPYLKRMDDRRPAILLDEGLARWRSPRGYVENIAEAIALAAIEDRAAGRIYNVAEEESPTEQAWIERIGEAVGWRGRVVALPPERLPEHLRSGIESAQDLVMDSTCIRQELGYREPIGQAEALRQTISWERAHPPAQVDPQQFDYAAEDAARERATEL